MKNTFLHLVLALIALFTFSCNKTVVSKDATVVNLGDNRVDNLSKLFEVVDLVKLEEADDALFRTITQLKVIDNKVYILDMMSNKILCFNIDGTFNRVLCAVGQGPGEYTQLTEARAQRNSVRRTYCNCRYIAKCRTRSLADIL